MLEPKHTEFMDADMLRLWHKLNAADLPGYRLYGGTALAMYFNHRNSTDFDFFRLGEVLKKDIEKLPWLKDARFKGSYGLVDAVLPGQNRNLILNFVSIETFNTIAPAHPPLKAPNGVEIAHPIDLIACKLAALANRKLFRDYVDIAETAKRAPEILDEAIEIYLADSMTQDETPIDLAKTLLKYAFEVEYQLAPEHRKIITSLASRLNEMPPHSRIKPNNLQDTSNRKDEQRKPLPRTLNTLRE